MTRTACARFSLAEAIFACYLMNVFAPVVKSRLMILTLPLWVLMPASCRNGLDQALQPPPPVPLLAVSADTLDYDSTGISRSLTLKNIGGAALDWSFTAWSAWANPSVSSGSLATLDSTTVPIELDRNQLAVGTHAGALQVSSSDSGRTVVLLATVSPRPVLGQMPDTLDFGAFLDSLELTIRNTGSDTLTWSLSFSAPTFHASQLAGSAVSTCSIWIYFDRDASSTGFHQATLQISSNGGGAEILLLSYAGATTGQWLTHLSAAPETAFAPYPSDYYFLVRFTKPADFSSYRISRVRAKFYTLYGAYDAIQLLCFSLVEQNGYWFPDVQYGLLHYSPELNPEPGWNEWTVDWTMTQEAFAVGYFQKDFAAPIFPQPYYTAPGAAGNSYRLYLHPQGYFMMELLADWEWCIEVYVEPIFASKEPPPRPISGLRQKAAETDPFPPVQPSEQLRTIPHPDPKHCLRNVVITSP